MPKQAFKMMTDNVYETPKWFFDVLNKEFNFTYDLACLPENKKTEKGFYPEDNSLSKDWHKIDGWLWLNPPYSPLKPWIEKAQKESTLGAKIVMLVPPIVTTRYFINKLPEEIRFIIGRLDFLRNGVPTKGNSSDSCILIYSSKQFSKTIWILRDEMKGKAYKNGKEPPAPTC